MPTKSEFERELRRSGLFEVFFALKNNLDPLRRLYHSTFPNWEWQDDIVDWLDEMSHFAPVRIPVARAVANTLYFDEYVRCRLNQGGATIHSAAQSVMERIEYFATHDYARKVISGLIAGRVQSGKTGTYCGLMIYAFERYGYNLQIVLTSAKNQLQEQTRQRINEDIPLNIGIDIENAAAGCDSNKLNYLVVQKNSSASHLGHVQRVLRELSEREGYRILIIDDESDNYTPNSGNNNQQYTEINFLDDLEELAASEDEIKKNAAELLARLYYNDDGRAVEYYADPEGASAYIHPERCCGDEWDQCNNYATLLSEKGVIDYNAEQIRARFGIGTRIVRRRMIRFACGVRVERSAVNNAITNLLSMESNFDRMVYLAVTATPFADLLNESPENSKMFPSFIYSIPKSAGYFGIKELHGLPSISSFRADYDFPIFPVTDDRNLAEILTKNNLGECQEFDRALKYFILTAAVRKLKNSSSEKEDDHKSTMLVNVSHRKTDILNLSEKIRNYLAEIKADNLLIYKLENIYNEEKSRLSKDIFADRTAQWDIPYPLENVNELPDFRNLDIEYVLENLSVITLVANETGDFSIPRIANTGFRDKAFITVGGFILSRGLTLPGLTVSYFSRENKVNCDTLFQMCRWFGYRPKYELLPRIWMPRQLQNNMKKLAFIESHFHAECQRLYSVDDDNPEPIDLRKNPSLLQLRVFTNLRLTGHDRNQERTRAVSPSYVPSRISKDIEDWNNLFGITDNFLRNIADNRDDNPHYRQEAAILFRNISRTRAVEFIESILPCYPGDFADHLNYAKNLLADHVDVVLGNVRGAERRQFTVGGIRVCSAQRQNQINADKSAFHFASFRDAKNFLVAVPQEIVDAEEGNDTSDDFRQKVFEKAGYTNSVIQILLDDPAALVDDGTEIFNDLKNSTCPIIAISLCLPGVTSDMMIDIVAPAEELPSRNNREERPVAGFLITTYGNNVVRLPDPEYVGIQLGIPVYDADNQEYYLYLPFEQCNDNLIGISEENRLNGNSRRISEADVINMKIAIRDPQNSAAMEHMDKNLSVFVSSEIVVDPDNKCLSVDEQRLEWAMFVSGENPILKGYEELAYLCDNSIAINVQNNIGFSSFKTYSFGRNFTRKRITRVIVPGKTWDYEIPAPGKKVLHDFFGWFWENHQNILIEKTMDSSERRYAESEIDLRNCRRGLDLYKISETCYFDQRLSLADVCKEMQKLLKDAYGDGLNEDCGIEFI